MHQHSALLACPHRNGANCAIAARLAGLERVTTATDPACEYCTTRATPARDRNKVTCDLAAAALRLAGRADDAWALIRSAPDIYPPRPTSSDRLRAIEAGHGVGSQIWRLLAEIGVQHDPSCDCLAWAEKLNAWGVAGCRLARAEIVEHLRSERQRYGWARSIIAAARAAAGVASDLAAWRRPWLNPLDPFGSLVDEAIRRAGEREGVSPPVAPGTDPQLPITDHV
jgi:hypothetical protein